ncbi:MAG: AAA family ATPase [Nitrospirae bacterium]|nr:AAA family ATPase [Nitrospirota bacterium]
MYKEYFGFREQPFSIAPDPRYLYMSEQHREALAHLVYGFNSFGGFVLLTGEVGTGKTTVCRCLLEKIPENASIAFIFNPKLSVNELLETICDEFGIKYNKENPSNKAFTDLINAYLLDTHSRDKKAVLIIDEAQNLSPDVLEQLRLLTNLETSQKKLLQIILLGQPELREKLSRPELRQLSQRIIARYHLGPLSKKDISAYVKHRLSIAGLEREVFPQPAIDRLYSLSKGIPRIINLLCDRALLGTFALGRQTVNKRTIDKAAKEVLDAPRARAFGWTMPLLFGASLSAIFAIVFAVSYDRIFPEKPVDAVTLTENMINAEVAHEPKPDTVKLERPSIQPEESLKTAFKSLFTAWGAGYDKHDSRTPCLQAKAQGLNCLNGQGNFENLLAINLPAVLRLFDEEGREYYATLTSVDRETGKLFLEEKSIMASLEEIESHWPGEYTLLWKTPPGYSGDIRPGERGKRAKWLDAQLAVINKREPSGKDNIVYDNEVVNEVKRFQFAKGLTPDGIIGTQTFMRLISSTSDKMPRLSDKAGK